MYAGDDIGGNADYYLYASNRGCWQLVGKVTQSVVGGTPRCAEPSRGSGAICELSTMRFMIHGDQYEYFYTCVAGECFEAGVGGHVESLEKFRRRRP